jgi:hypothetical protein
MTFTILGIAVETGERFDKSKESAVKKGIFTREIVAEKGL